LAVLAGCCGQEAHVSDTAWAPAAAACALFPLALGIFGDGREAACWPSPSHHGAREPRCWGNRGLRVKGGRAVQRCTGVASPSEGKVTQPVARRPRPLRGTTAKGVAVCRCRLRCLRGCRGSKGCHARVGCGRTRRVAQAWPPGNLACVACMLLITPPDDKVAGDGDQ
jgi:hypothetical protein